MVVHPPALRAPVSRALHHALLHNIYLIPRLSRPVSAKNIMSSSRSERDDGGVMVRRWRLGRCWILRGSNIVWHREYFISRYQLAVVHKAGGLPLVTGMLMGTVQVVARRARKLETWLDVCVREDRALKQVGVQ